MALEGDVKLPVFGQVPKKKAATVGAVLALLAGIVWYRHRGTAAAANAGAGEDTSADADLSAAAGSDGLESDPYPPDGTIGDASDPNSTDPATGATYGDEDSGYGIPGLDSSGGIGGIGTGVITGSFTSDAQWAQAAQAYLVDNEGADAGTVGTALGAYIAGADVTEAQKEIIEAAIAFEGNPPVAGPGGYPPSIRLVKGGTGGGTTTAKKPAKAPGGESTGGITQNRAVVRWTSEASATSYRVRVWEDLPGGNTRNIYDHTDKATAQTVTGLKAGTKYGWHVAAVNSAGTGPWSGNRHFTTAKAAKKPKGAST